MRVASIPTAILVFACGHASAARVALAQVVPAQVVPAQVVPAGADPEAELVEQEVEREAQKEAYGNDLHLGASASLGLPHWKGALEGRYGGFGVTAAYGWVPRRVGGVKLALTNFEIGLRAMPGDGGFYFGAALGQQDLRASKSASGVEEIEKLRSRYVTPFAGFEWRPESRFFVAHELGFVVFASSERDEGLRGAEGTASGDGGRGAGGSGPASPAGPSATALAERERAARNVHEVATRYGRWWTPHVAFLKLGYLH